VSNLNNRLLHSGWLQPRLLLLDIRLKKLCRDKRSSLSSATKKERFYESSAKCGSNKIIEYFLHHSLLRDGPERCHDSQHNDNGYNDTQHNNTVSSAIILSAKFYVFLS
jgi:hypothetical protein